MMTTSASKAPHHVKDSPTFYVTHNMCKSSKLSLQRCRHIKKKLTALLKQILY
jgi:hypothetical protein